MIYSYQKMYQNAVVVFPKDFAVLNPTAQKKILENILSFLFSLRYSRDSIVFAEYIYIIYWSVNWENSTHDTENTHTEHEFVFIEND